MILFSVGAPLTPAGGSSCNLHKMIHVNSYNNHVTQVFLWAIQKWPEENALCLPYIYPEVDRTQKMLSAEFIKEQDDYTSASIIMNFSCKWVMTIALLNAVVTCEIKLFQNYFSLRRCLSEIILFQCGNLPEIISIISEAYCSSWIFSNMFNVAEIILK